jgi:hypothetical protein
MRKPLLVATTVLAATTSLLLLGACGNSSTGNATAQNQQQLVEATTSPAAASGEIGSAVKTKAGVTVEISKPTQFTPGKFVSQNLTAGNVNNSFSIKVTNGGTAPLDLTTMVVTSSTGAAQSCVDVLDADNGFAGAPMDPVAAGASVDVKWAISCVGKVGSPLSIVINVNGENLAELKGSLA